ncbi:MAG: RND transporter, partial [Gammaproteobacteria bacterium]|nr:RND transporter [Gammaproteobacteria bacterium]
MTLHGYSLLLPSPAVLCAVISLLLAGCAAVGPEYQAPEPALPAHWQAAADAGPPDAAVLAEWWRQFEDPLLNALVSEALAANRDLATARAQLREARARRALAGAQLGPAVEATASAARTTSSETLGTGATRDLYSAGFDAAWEPDIFGRLRRGREAAAAELDASLETLRDTQVSLAAEVVLNYADLRTAQRRLAVAEASVAARRETHDLTRWRWQAGLVPELDVAQARTELESAQAALPVLRSAVSAARHRLAVLLGRNPGALRERLAATAAVPLAGRAAAAGIP